MSDRDPFWTLSRLLASLVAVAQVTAAWYLVDAGAAVRVAGFCVLPLVCIWFSREMGAYRGIGLGFPAAVTRTSPASVVFAIGWLLLLAPTIAGVVYWLCYIQSTAI